MGIATLSLSRTRTIDSANFMVYPDGCLHPDRTMKCHDLFIVLEGAWEVVEDGKAYLLEPGDAILLFAGRHHRGNNPCARGTKTIYIHFSLEEGDIFLPRANAGTAEDSTLDIATVVHTGAGDLKIRGLFADIVYSSWSRSSYNRKRARALLGLLLVELARKSNNEEFNPAVMPVKHVMELLERNPDRNYSIGQLAKAVSMSPRVLTKRFRSIEGVSIKQFHLRHKIRVACSVLDNTPSTTMSTLADMLGFSDQYHFSHAFKKIAGVSPDTYRRRATPKRAR